MPIIEDESSTGIEDEAGEPIEDEAGMATLLLLGGSMGQTMGSNCNLMTG